jgi:two-component system sensor histidine kinase KdpD
MQVSERPNPDELLTAIKSEESGRGKLKIFFGASAGVGKTYAMLEEAIRLKKEGVDVVVGYAETHERAETKKLLEGLEILPLQKILYKNITLQEFDLDAAIRRHPKIILVDELAHTNSPGVRHTKRWQDIEELLDEGINVYTTLNVQHCESVNDIVAEVTQVQVHETVPDTFVEKADEIELVDLPTDDLLARLKEGKVYLGDMADRAAQNFFQVGNLIALRELSLRYTERDVNEKLLTYRKVHSVSKTWNVSDRFLICISDYPEGFSLIRSGKRIASDLGIEWFVANVEKIGLLAKERDQLAAMMHFAEKLGAQTASLSGDNVAEALVTYARAKNITVILIGKPSKHSFLKKIFHNPIVDDLALKCGEIDIYILSGDKEKTEPPVAVFTSPFPRKNILKTLGILTLCTVVNGFLFNQLALVNLIMIYLLGVTWIAFRYGRRLSIIASLISVLLFDFFFVPPYLSFAVSDTQYVSTFIIMLIVGMVIASLTGQLRHQTIRMHANKDRLEALYEFTRKLSKSSIQEELFDITLRHIEETFRVNAFVLAPDDSGKLRVYSGTLGQFELDPNEKIVAQWSYEHGKKAGKGTETLSSAKVLYLPLTEGEKKIGVIGIVSQTKEQFIDPDQLHLLEIFVTQAAAAVEGARIAAESCLAKNTNEVKMERETAKV